jgi:hypothetical protein
MRGNRTQMTRMGRISADYFLASLEMTAPPWETTRDTVMSNEVEHLTTSRSC